MMLTEAMVVVLAFLLAILTKAPRCIRPTVVLTAARFEKLVVLAKVALRFSVPSVGTRLVLQANRKCGSRRALGCDCDRPT